MKFTISSLCLLSLTVPLSLAQPKPVRSSAPKNIIFMVGDGMGTAQIFAGLTANHGTLNLERCTAIGFQKTQSADKFVTDSGAGATAFSIGKKAKNGAIGVDAQDQPQATILETAKKSGLGTAIVVTCSITHATPASFYAHVPSRSQNEDIAADLLKGAVDVFVGGGKKYFDQRKDGKNLVEALKTQGYQVADSTADLNPFKTGKLAVFTSEGEPRRISEGRGDILLNGTSTAIRLLNQNRKGFFMLIEGSQIDWGGHANQTEYITSEMRDFDKTIGAVLDFAKKDGNTLVVITADHETGGLAIADGNMKTGQVTGQYVTKGHTGIMVPVFAYGPGAETFIGIYENTAIFTKMMQALHLK